MWFDYHTQLTINFKFMKIMFAFAMALLLGAIVYSIVVSIEEQSKLKKLKKELEEQQKGTPTTHTYE